MAQPNPPRLIYASLTGDFWAILSLNSSEASLQTEQDTWRPQKLDTFATNSGHSSRAGVDSARSTVNLNRAKKIANLNRAKKLPRRGFTKAPQSFVFSRVNGRNLRRSLGRTEVGIMPYAAFTIFAPGTQTLWAREKYDASSRCRSRQPGRCICIDRTGGL
jgi:hypothetical protein